MDRMGGFLNWEAAPEWVREDYMIVLRAEALAAKDRAERNA